MYISCQHGNRIYNFGHGKLIAYIPSLGRGRNITKALKENSVEYTNYIETDEEVEFRFKATDIEIVAELMKAKTSGASISPFSSKNLVKRKDIIIPQEEVGKYKEIISVIDKKDLLIINRITKQFINNMEKSLKKSTKDKAFDIKKDMKKSMLSRQSKEYIYYKNYWNKYLKYLENEINTYYLKEEIIYEVSKR